MPATDALLPVNQQGAHRRLGPDAASFYRPELDVLRFLAFLAVFFCHGLRVNPPHLPTGGLSMLWWLYGACTEAGNFGVCMFFLLSSYLITSLLNIESEKTNRIHLRSFYTRRILRIWPLYLSVILFFFIAGHFLLSLRMERSQLLAYVLFAGNWYIVAHPGIQAQLNWLWSISVEEQFYLAWPLVAKIGGMRWVSWLCFLLIPVSVFVIATKTANNLYATVWLNSLVQFQFLALGALLALWMRGRIPHLRPLYRLTMASSGMACWVIASGVCKIKSPDVNPGVTAMCLGYELVALGSVLMFLSILGLPRRHLPRFAIYLGKISYGLYVFHEIALSWTTAIRRLFESELSGSNFLRPAAFLVDRAAALGLTIALAALSYKFLEFPFLRMKQRFTFIRSRSA